MIIYRRISQPTAEPLTLDQAKLHIRVEVDVDDDLILALISAARQAAENYCNRSFALAEFAIMADAFPSGGIALLPDVAALVSFDYLAADGTEASVSSSDVVIDNVRRVLRLADATAAWPAGSRLQVNISAGPDTGASPPELPDQAVLAAIKLILGDLYENREAAFVGTIHSVNPAALSLLTPYRVDMGM